MQTKYITFGEKKYRVDGTKRTGFTVYEVRLQGQVYLGQVYTVETHKQALIHIVRNSYCSHY